MGEEVKYYCKKCSGEIKSKDEICTHCGSILKKVGRRIKLSLEDSITLSSSVTIIKIHSEARKELDKLSEEYARIILDKAIEISKEQGHPYDITVEDIIEAKSRRRAKFE